MGRDIEGFAGGAVDGFAELQVIQHLQLGETDVDAVKLGPTM